MKTKSWSFSLSLALSALVLQSLAYGESKTLSIDEVVKAALDASPIVIQIEGALSGRRADAFEAKTLSNPSLETEFGVPVASKDAMGNNEVSVSLSQPFKLSHGSLRNRLADLLEEAGNSEKEQAVLELVTKARIAFAHQWLLSEREKLLQEVQPKTKSLTQFVSSGLKLGAYGKGDEAVFRTEVAKTEAELLGIQAEKLAAEAELTRITGRSFEGFTLSNPGVFSSIPVSTVELQLSQGELKVQRRAKILVNLARADSAVANRDAFPELRPKLFYSRTNEGVDLVGVGLSFDLPFYSQNTAERMRKTSEVLTAESQAAFFQGEAFKSSVLKSVKMYELRRQEVLLYEKKVTPAVKEALHAFEAQVRGGEGSVFQLWQTLREYLEIQERYLDLWTRAFAEYLELSILLGQEL